MKLVETRLIHKLSQPRVFHRLQYAKTEGEGLGVLPLRLQLQKKTGGVMGGGVLLGTRLEEAAYKHNVNVNATTERNS